MTRSRGTRDPQALWQGQPADPRLVGIEDIRRQAATFGRTIRRRNVREYLAAVFVFAFFGWHALADARGFVRAGSALIVLGTAVVVLHLRRHGTTGTPPVEELVSTCLAFHRCELERQRDLLRSVPRWYLTPLVPGLAVLFLGSGLEKARAGAGVPLQPVLGVLGFALLFLAIAWVNAKAAREVQRELDELETPEP
jgi:hypothetical protein